ncbi:hypothetical protein ACLOJK_019600 [Asimina triloba]
MVLWNPNKLQLDSILARSEEIRIQKMANVQNLKLATTAYGNHIKSGLRKMSDMWRNHLELMKLMEGKMRSRETWQKSVNPDSFSQFGLDHSSVSSSTTESGFLEDLKHSQFQDFSFEVGRKESICLAESSLIRMKNLLLLK